MKKNPQTKARQKRVLALVKTKFPRRRKGWGLILIVERKLHKASPGNEQAFHVRKSNK